MSTPGSSRRAARIRVPRGAIIAGLTAFLVLASTGIAAAVWTSASSSLGGTVSAGTLSVTIAPTDVANLSAIYSPSVLSHTAAMPVTNSGTVPADYTVEVKAAANGLSNATTLTGWLVTTASQCTATSAAGAQSGSAVLSTGLSTTDSVAVGAVDIFCVRTTIPATYATTMGPASIPTVTLSYSQGSWNGSSSATATQTVADTVAPTRPGRPAASATSAAKTTLTWAASTDNAAVTSYDVYRDGTLLGSVAAPTVSFTDTGLTGGTRYSYTVKARDAADNVSAASSSRSVTTTAFDTSVNYQVKFTSANLCVDGGVSPGANGNNLVTLACQTGRSQTWQFVNVSGADYKIFSTATPNLVWDISGASTTDGSSAITWNWSGNNNQLWTITSEGNGKVHFTSVNSGKCLALKSNTAGTQVQQYTCDGTATQTFTLTQVP
ncbi:RICIN domain-containing protein [Frigoribacterium sp. UYMn621]|uniref:RICIN domain-containing protein n=1 Tax=Frigoribacterium sp. UYMn621 TaxID=3156343 RepID=UPI00339616D0